MGRQSSHAGEGTIQSNQKPPNLTAHKPILSKAPPLPICPFLMFVGQEDEARLHGGHDRNLCAAMGSGRRHCAHPFGVTVPDPDVPWWLSLWSGQPCPLDPNMNMGVFNFLARIPLRITGHYNPSSGKGGATGVFIPTCKHT